MSDLDTFATIRGDASALEAMVRQSAVGYHDEIYLRAVGSEDTVHVMTQTNGRQVMSYCTFSHLTVDGDAEAIVPTGLDNDTKGYLDYLDIAGSGEMEIRLLGEADDGDQDHPRLASYWEAEGALSARVRLPASQSDLQHVPWGLPDRFVDGEYVSAVALADDGSLAVDEANLDDYTPPTSVTLDAGTVEENIVEPAEFLGVNYYPFVVAEDGTFRVDMEEASGDDRISGTVPAESVEGPAVDRSFDEGFAETVDELTGRVVLSTAPEPEGDGPAPPLVVQREPTGQDVTLRHVLCAFSED